MHVNRDNINQEVFHSSIPVILDFYSDSCMPCRVIAPILDDISNEYSNKIKVCKLNINEYSDVAEKYGVMAVPTLMYIKNGREINRTIGLIEKEEILRMINL